LFSVCKLCFKEKCQITLSTQTKETISKSVSQEVMISCEKTEVQGSSILTEVNK
jgi:hypothetical protein